MKIRIEMLRPAVPLKQLLERAGWQVTQEEEALLLLSDDMVDSEELARRRLYDLGLLISGRVRIEFLMIGGPHRTALNRTSSARSLEGWRRTRSRPRRCQRRAGSS